jgi:hypothetical protein
MKTRANRRTLALAGLAACLLAAPVAALPASAGTATAASTDLAAWAPADEATIHPGVQTQSPSGQCTSNFIFTNGSDVLIGHAAHCTGSSAATSTNGCEQDPEPLPLGTQIEIEGASRPGTLVYSSWNAMLAAGETDEDACAFNDFALIRIDPADVAKVNPSVPAWGGPQGTGTSSSGEQVYTYGNSSLRGGITTLSPKTGTTLSADPSGWSYDVYTATPGIPGDSGSAVLNDGGNGLGILVTVQIAPFAGSNGVTDLAKAIAYARTHGLSGLTLVDGTEPFDGSIGAGIGL